MTKALVTILMVINSDPITVVEQIPNFFTRAPDITSKNNEKDMSVYTRADVYVWLKLNFLGLVTQSHLKRKIAPSIHTLRPNYVSLRDKPIKDLKLR